MASTMLSPVVDYYNDEEDLDSVDEDDDRSFRGRDSEEGTCEVTKIVWNARTVYFSVQQKEEHQGCKCKQYV